MSKRYSGKSQKDRSFMKKAKLSLKEKRKLKRERKNKYCVEDIAFVNQLLKPLIW